VDYSKGRYRQRKEKIMNGPVSYLRTVTLSFFSLVLMAHPISVYAQTAQQIAKKAFPSVVLLVMEDANGQPGKDGGR
jgi:hypothetical protein